MRRLLITLSLVAALGGASATAGGAAATPPAPTAFVLTGGGWGHGVGMSQWGALGQAKDGRDYRAILAYYYPGTTLGPSPSAVPAKVRVLVADGLASVSVSAPGAIAVADGSGTRARVGGPVTIGSKLRLTAATGDATQLQEPVTLRPAGGGRLAVAGTSYRGALRVIRSGKKLQLVNVVGLEAYLLGVVPGEMPKDWPLGALEAQAVAARTYALANLVEGRSFDLYSDVRSQLYYGIDAESPATTRAVEETRGQVLSFAGTLARTFYFSSSGGRTLSALDVFGEDVPYLVSVPDPWDELSPNHRWEPRIIGSAPLARRLGLRGSVSDVTTVPGASGEPASLRLTTTTGATVDMRLADVRTRLGLKSLDFRLGVLRLDRPLAQPSAGVVRLTGLARGVEAVALQRRSPGESWISVAPITPSPDGSFAIRVRVATTTAFRLTASGLAGPALTLRIPT